MAKMLIAGEQVDSESGQTTEVRNPATGEPGLVGVEHPSLTSVPLTTRP